MKPMINPLLTQLLGDATRLTQHGRLADATAAIQRALESAVLGSPATTPPATAQKTPAGANSNVLDGLVRDAGAPATPADQAAAHFGAGSYTAQSGTRQYKLFVPGGFGARRLPLIVMLHGCTQDPDDFAAGTRMNLLAQEAGVVVLYPAQAPRSNASKCWNWFQPADQKRGQGEPELLAAMSRHIIATQPVDSDKVYIAGLSAGGAMAAIMGREYPDLFAAVGVHSGLAAGAAHDVGSAFAAMQSGAAGAGSAPLRGAFAAATATSAAAVAPTIVFHGDRDTTVHPDNGAQVISAQAAAATRRDDSGNAGRRYQRSVFTDASGQVQAEHWLVHGAGHAWSGGSAEGSYADALGPDASREMLRFFLEHPRRAPTVATTARTAS